MNSSKWSSSATISPERIAEIQAFKDIDISDCPELTGEELKRLKPRHLEYFRPIKQAVQIRLDADVLAWSRPPGRAIKAGLTPH